MQTVLTLKESGDLMLRGIMTSLSALKNWFFALRAPYNGKAIDKIAHKKRRQLDVTK